MLQELAIRNFAIIDDLNIRFNVGLTILSGETGAGKSIVIQAVNLLLGSRASGQMVRTGTDAAELEAMFQVDKDSPVAAAMVDHGYNADDGLLIRRVISKNNRHRIHINGRLATLSILNGIVEHLASISGQHAHQILLKAEHHLDILDQYAGLQGLKAKVKVAFTTLLPLIEELNRLLAIQDGRSEHFRLLAFQRDEIANAGIKPDEDEKLEQKRQQLKNAEMLRQAVFNCVELMYAMDGAAVERLTQAERSLEKARRIDPELERHAQKIADAGLVVEDLTDTLRSYLATVDVDEKTLENVEERIDTLVKLKHKYGGSLEAVLAHLRKAELELAKVENISDAITSVEKKIFKQHQQLAKLCRLLSKKREQTAKKLAREVEAQLQALHMAHTRFKVVLTGLPVSSKTPPHLTIDNCVMTETGIDQAMFMIAPNVGEALKPLSDIASGGELSRLVLALKVILAENDAVGTVVFDEVDAGIGGSTAELVGRKLTDLAKSHQVICITHLPQIARFGDHHFRIDKNVIDGRTISGIEPIADKQRIQELARMLGGEKITRKTMDHAKEMLKNR